MNRVDNSMIIEESGVEIIHCEECQFLNAGANESDVWYQCSMLRYKDVYPSFFCAFGERRKGDEVS